jgi:hypothetical protein
VHGCADSPGERLEAVCGCSLEVMNSKSILRCMQALLSSDTAVGSNNPTSQIAPGLVESRLLQDIDDSKGSSENRTAAIVVSAIAAVVVLCAATVAGFIILRRYHRPPSNFSVHAVPCERVDTQL